MIKLIALRELKANVLSLRFKLTLLLCAILIPISLLVSIKNFEAKKRVYDVQIALAIENSHPRVYSFIRPEIIKPIEPLSIFSNGINFNVGSKIKIRIGEITLFTEGKTIVRENPFTNRFIGFDFVTALTIILSLMGLLFTYDSCTKEKETGTFKLVMSNPVSRAKVLAGKLAGVLGTFTPILFFAYLLSVGLIIYIAPVRLFLNDWLRIGFLFGFSFLYLLVFSMMGILISANSKSSKRSIISSLLVWITLVFIVPSLSGYLAQGLIKVSSFDNIRVQLEKIENTYNEEVHEYEKRIDPGQGRNYWNYWGDDDGQLQIFGSKKSTYEFHRQLNAFAEPLRIDYADKKWPVQVAFHQELMKQRNFAQYFSYISPSEVFQAVASALCKTDYQQHMDFIESVRNYRLELIQYFYDKDLFNSYLYFTRVPAEKFTQEFSWDDENKDPALSSPEHYEPLDMADVPKYNYANAGVGENFISVLPPAVLLLIIIIILFNLSYYSFIRFDIR